MEEAFLATLRVGGGEIGKLSWQLLEQDGAGYSGAFRVSEGMEDSVLISLRVSGEKREQAIMPAIRVSGGGKELVLLSALTAGRGRLKEALPEPLRVGDGDRGSSHCW